MIFIGQYGLEGGESMIPALDSLFAVASRSEYSESILVTNSNVQLKGGIQHIVVGKSTVEITSRLPNDKMTAMPHRGRLNLLTGLLEFPPTALFHKIKGGSELPDEYGGEGDVISHLGISFLALIRQPVDCASSCISFTELRQCTQPSQGFTLAKSLTLRFVPNKHTSSWLTLLSEAVNPVALGKTRAKQFSLLKTSSADCQLGDRVMCVQLHGDASFTGQGVIMESLGLSTLFHHSASLE